MPTYLINLTCILTENNLFLQCANVQRSVTHKRARGAAGSEPPRPDLKPTTDNGAAQHTNERISSRKKKEKNYKRHTRWMRHRA